LGWTFAATPRHRLASTQPGAILEPLPAGIAPAKPSPGIRPCLKSSPSGVAVVTRPAVIRLGPGSGHVNDLEFCPAPPGRTECSEKRIRRHRRHREKALSSSESRAFAFALVDQPENARQPPRAIGPGLPERGTTFPIGEGVPVHLARRTKCLKFI
jgi:hypothetical protein